MRGPTGPAALLDAWAGMGAAAISAAMSLGVIGALARGPAPIERLARAVGPDTDEETLAAILEALQALGYVVRRGGRYSLSPMGRRNLVDGDRDGAAALRFWPRALPTLTETLSGRLRGDEDDVRDWFRAHRALAGPFLDWQASVAQRSALDLARRLPVPLRARRVVVQGGGDAVLATALATRHPQLDLVIHDVPEAVARGEELVAATPGVGDRIRFVPSDLVQGDPPADADIFVITQSLHRFSTEAQRRLLRKAMQALRPGGILAIVEPAAVPSMLPAQAAAVRVTGLWLHALAGNRIPSAAVLAAWVRDTGFAYARYRRLRGVGLSLVTGRRPRRTPRGPRAPRTRVRSPTPPYG